MKLSEDLWFPAKIQHGWAYETNIEWFNREIIKDNSIPVLSWGDRFYDGLLEHNVESIKIGAPILYKDNIDMSWIEPDVNSAIYFPAHGKDGILATDYNTLVQVKDDLPVDKITVCLHPHDYTKEIMSILTDAGFSCTTAGNEYRSGFLWRCLALMAAHGIVAGNSISSASFYAALVNRPFVLAGSYLTNNWPKVIGKERAKDFFPEFLTLSRVHKDISMQELGANYVKAPDELRRAILTTSSRWGAHELQELPIWAK